MSFDTPIKHETRSQALCHSILDAVLQIDAHPSQDRLIRRLDTVESLVEVAGMLKTTIKVYRLSRDAYDLVKQIPPEQSFGGALHLLHDDNTWFMLKPKHKEVISIDLSWLHTSPPASPPPLSIKTAPVAQSISANTQTQHGQIQHGGGKLPARVSKCRNLRQLELMENTVHKCPGGLCPELAQQGQSNSMVDHFGVISTE